MIAVLPSREVLRETAHGLMDCETRPQLVQSALEQLVAKLGADNVVDAKAVEYVASLSTHEGLMACKEQAITYISKAKDKEGRQEMVAEAKSLTSSHLIAPASSYASAKYAEVKEGVSDTVSDVKEGVKGFAEAKLTGAKEAAAPYVAAAHERAAPYVEAAQARAAPYVASSRELAAPYLAKLESRREAITSGKRYEAAMAKLAMAREHPAELASEMRAKAVDLIRYDDVKAYRDYVLSPAFQADTRRLVAVELPAITASAASKGAEGLKGAAAALSAEVEAGRAKVAEAMSKGYELAQEVDVAALRERLVGAAALLLSELQAEAKDGYAHLKAEGLSALTLAETASRVRRVANIVDKVVISPTKEFIAPIISPERASAKPGTVDDANPRGVTPTIGFELPADKKAEAEAEAEADDDADDEMADAIEPGSPGSEMSSGM